MAVHSAPAFASNDGVADILVKSLGNAVIKIAEAYGEISVTVKRDNISAVSSLIIIKHF